MTNTPATSSNADLEPGQAVGEYVVEARIGAGGFGAVYRATHPLIGKQVAIKVLSRSYSAQPDMVSRFIAEARSVNQIRHRNIIDIFGFGQLDDGRHYFVMELLEGQPLDAYLAAHGRLTLEEAVVILRGVARALDAAHAAGIIHRDIKPENIFLCIDGDGDWAPKLLDFGIAKAFGGTPEGMHKTRTGAPIGTPYYMSPEQCRGRDVDRRTDVYAFGCVAYELVTGQVPFDGEDYMEILMKQIGDAPPKVAATLPGLAALDGPIGWMLAKDPGERPDTLAAAMTAFEGAATASGVALPTARHGGTPSRMTPVPLRRTPSPVAAMSTAETVDLTPAPGVAGAATIAATSAPTAARRGRWPLVIGALAVVAVGAVVAIKLGGGGAPASKPAATPTASAPVTPTPVAPTPVAPTAIEPPPVAPPEADPPAPATVTITLTGTPAGAVVRTADGVEASVPGALVLPRGEAVIELTVSAPGHKPATERVTPSADAALAIKLTPTRTGRKPRPSSGGNPLLEDPFRK